MKRKLFSVVLSAALMLNLCILPAKASATFTDVPSGVWYESFVEKAAQKHIVDGVGNGKFAPNLSLSNASFVTMVTRTLFGEVEHPSTGPWWLFYCDALQERGLLFNTALNQAYADHDNSWSSAIVNAPINRYEMAQILYNCSNMLGELRKMQDPETLQIADPYVIAAQEHFKDFDQVPAQYKDALVVCYSLRLIDGDANGNFKGTETMTRAQAAKVLINLSEVMNGNDDIVDPTPSVPTPSVPTPETPALSEDAVHDILMSQQSQYPEGMPWDNSNSYVSKAYPYTMTGYGCAGFAFLMSDLAFGDLPIQELHRDFTKLRVGDTIRMNHDTHSAIILEVHPDSVVIAEGNYNSSIHWGRSVSRASLESGEFYAETRYPV